MTWPAHANQAFATHRTNKANPTLPPGEFGVTKMQLKHATYPKCQHVSLGMRNTMPALATTKVDRAELATFLKAQGIWRFLAPAPNTALRVPEEAYP